MIDEALLARAASLSPAERLELIGALWDTIPHSELPVTDQEKRLLDARLADADRNPEAESLLSETKARLGPDGH
ncbi:MAG: putative addiction module component (TIGR02574 family) [Hyphomicrobiaceae bacterium]|jgi:putative addiction module component (TIGR02574 family)